jgi:general secretion pathway protein K
MKSRRGVALLTALWLVVGIAVVTLQFSLDAHERRLLGINAAERGVQRAAAAGALAMMQARLDYALRTRNLAGNAATGILRSSDPWLDVDSLYSGPILVDSIAVDVHAWDAGTQLNINTLTEDEFKTFFGFILNNYTTADELAQSIMDWRDLDDVPRVHGGERDDYIKAGLLALPANGPFREVSDLLDVKGMTPEIFAKAEPYLTTRGATTINLNTAPPAVLRVLPGMTDAILAQILSLRSQGRRIMSVQQVMSATQRGRPMSAAVATANAQVTQRLAARASVETNQVAMTFTVRAAPQAQPIRLLAIVQRASNGGQNYASVLFRQW